MIGSVPDRFRGGQPNPDIDRNPEGGMPDFFPGRDFQNTAGGFAGIGKGSGLASGGHGGRNDKPHIDAVAYRGRRERANDHR